MTTQGPMGFPAHIYTSQEPIGPQPSTSLDKEEDSGYVNLMGSRD